MTRAYATLFDHRYFPQGLALYESLVKHSSEEFTLHVLPMDMYALEYICRLDLSNICIREIDYIEQVQQLKRARQERSWTEYCWTLGSNLTDYILRHDGMDAITYIDADCFFFSDPKVIFDEIGDRSIAVIPHRLAENDQKERLSKNGLFNVSWVTFKNNDVGRECLSTWAAQVRERCSAEVGCGDQLYLDQWIKYGDKLAVIQNIGAGVAPWNLSSYEVTEGPKVDGKDVVFMHYHEFKALEISDIETALTGKRRSFRLTNYELRDEDRKYIYEPYLAAYKRAEGLISKVTANV